MAINFPASPNLNDTFTSGNTTWQWDGTSWNVVGGATPININSFATITADAGTTTANSAADTLTVQGGTGISTLVTGDTLQISYSGGGGGSDQNLWYTIISDSGLTTPDSVTDTLNVVGGSNIATSISGDTLTIAYTGAAGGASALNDLTDVNTAGIQQGDMLLWTGSSLIPTGRSFSTMYMPAIAMLNVGAVGVTAYTFSPHYTSNNPTVFALAGTTIAFDLAGSSGHPFEIQDPTGTPYNTGLVHVDNEGNVSTGTDAQEKESGVLYWQIPENISGNYRYQCTLHPVMVGAITIKRLSVI